MSCIKEIPQFFPSGAVFEKLSPVAFNFLQAEEKVPMSQNGKLLILFFDTMILMFLYSGTDFAFAGA